MVVVVEGFREIAQWIAQRGTGRGDMCLLVMEDRCRVALGWRTGGAPRAEASALVFPLFFVDVFSLNLFFSLVDCRSVFFPETFLPFSWVCPNLPLLLLLLLPDPLFFFLCCFYPPSIEFFFLCCGFFMLQV